MELYTITELARILKIPETTARYYRDRHLEYFHYTGTGRKKRYPPETLDVLRTICEQADNSKTAEHINKTLEARFNKQILIAEQDNSRTAEGTTSIQLMNTLTETLRNIADQKKEMQTLREEINELKEYIKTPVIKRIFKRKP